MNSIRPQRALTPALEPATDALLGREETPFDLMVEPLLRLLWLRDPDTAGHCRRVALYALKLCDALGIGGEERRVIGLGAMLHDLGKIGIPDAILFKPGPLDGREWSVMRAHPAHGRRVLDSIAGADEFCQLIFSHHERLDGCGYPEGLEGAEVTLGMRIVSLADAADAMLSHRPYRAALTLEHAAEELRRGAGAQFDADLVRIFIDAFDLPSAPSLQVAR